MMTTVFGLMLTAAYVPHVSFQPTKFARTSPIHAVLKIAQQTPPPTLDPPPPPPPAAASTAAGPKATAGTPSTESDMVLPPLPKSKIRRGDYVVHRHYGVGLFEGLFMLKGVYSGAGPDGEKKEVKALKVRFRDGVLEVVPKEAAKELKLFRRYEDVEAAYATVKLDGMRSQRSWQKRKERAAKKVWAVAGDLVRMYAERQALVRDVCEPDSDRYRHFETGFEYAPTPDQQRTFDEIAADMIESTQPMDRLVCGDVGFGKTEVAMRAIYRAVCAGRQVALLAPTTVLAAQHYRCLLKRMPDARVELLSSLVKRKASETAQVRDDVAAGDVQVLVGTHAILSNKVTFANLGLLVVDEEQRFGVRQKEKVKAAATNVDVLSLSATPIPRTMYMCMAGIRAMSTLATPPEGRLAVQTNVMERDDDAVLRAIKEEMARGGQVFYVVPRVEMVEKEVEMLTSALPDARVDFAYSGIRDLEQRIVDFTLGNTDVLVATTILENGIDIPNVNTIIVQATHLFGLAQLHQLRGRVGRASVQAYAYLMHPPRVLLSDDAMQRLRVLQRETQLGAGRALAQSDLQMRGAGNLFGEAQKGDTGMADIGLDLYVEVLQKAMRYLEQKRKLGLPDDPEVEAQLLQQAVDDSMLMDIDNALAQS